MFGKKIKDLEQQLREIKESDKELNETDLRELIEALVQHFIRTMDAIGMSTTVVTRHQSAKLILIMGDDDPFVAYSALKTGINGSMREPASSAIN